MSRPAADVRDEIERFQEACRRNGLKVTHQRLEIFRELARDRSHPSVESVYRRVKERLPTVSLDTVYRTLSTFEHLGLISRVQSLETVARYDPNPAPHHHLVCVRCRAIQDFSWPEFDRMEPPIPPHAWGRVHGRRVEIWGLCPRCAAGEG